MSPIPYIEVVGVTSRQEAFELLSAFQGKGLLGLGVKIDRQSLEPGGQAANRGLYVPLSKASEIFLNEPSIWNVLHFSTDMPAQLNDQIQVIAQNVSNDVDALQLNVRLLTYPNQLSWLVSILGQDIDVILEYDTRFPPPSIFQAILRRIPDNRLSVMITQNKKVLSFGEMRELCRVVDQVKAVSPSIKIGFQGTILSQDSFLLMDVFRQLAPVNLSAEEGLVSQSGSLSMSKAKHYISTAMKIVER